MSFHNTAAPCGHLTASEFLPKLWALLEMAFQFHLSATTSLFTFSSKTSYVFLCDSQIPLLHSRALNWCFCYEDQKFWVTYASFLSLSISLKEYFNPWNLGCVLWFTEPNKWLLYEANLWNWSFSQSLKSLFSSLQEHLMPSWVWVTSPSDACPEKLEE